VIVALKNRLHSPYHWKKVAARVRSGWAVDMTRTTQNSTISKYR